MINQNNVGNFRDLLTTKLVVLFRDDVRYKSAASKTTPEGLANMLTIGIESGKTNINGDAIKHVCRYIGIKNTYKAIWAYFND